VPDPEDILGSVRLSNGKIIPKTYEKMPTHRIYSSNGLFQLNDHLYEALVKTLKGV
jgi:hypothetical protein